MHSNRDTDGNANQLRFFCRDCRSVFEAAPDGTGYEQTPCPACGEMCLTVEFEQEEQQRNSREASFASFFIGLMQANSLGRLVWQTSNDEPESPKQIEHATIARYERREDAEADARILARQRIQATIVGEEAGVASAFASDQFPPIELQVPAPAAFTATKILRAEDPPSMENAVPIMSEEDVIFPCEECGEILSFPGCRRGKVEICPDCGEYVDVPH